MLIEIRRVLLTGSLIVLTMTCAHADRLVQPLSGIDTELKTIVTKSKISTYERPHAVIKTSFFGNKRFLRE